MRKVLLTALALCTMGIASAQMNGNQARVYAYGLDQVDETGTVTTYTLTFKTNTAATEASVNLKDANGDVKYTVPAVKTDDAGKAWEAVVDVYELNKLGKDVVAGDYTWEATVSAPEVTAWTTVYNSGDKVDGQVILNFYRSYGLEVDKSPESSNFGRVYMAHQATSGTNVPVGMYTFTPELQIENDGNPYKNDIFGIGEADTSTCSLADMCIAKDGRLFFTATKLDLYNVYAINPNNLEKVTKVFNNATLKHEIPSETYKKYVYKSLFASDGTRMTGVRGSIATYGEGENTTLMVLEPTYIYYKLWTSPINEFKIGEENTWDKAPTYTIATGGGDYMKWWDSENNKNVNCHIANASVYPSMEATKNGFWCVQYYSSSNNSIPTFIYYSRKTGKVEYRDVYTYPSNASSTALAVNEDLGLVAYAGTYNSTTKLTPAIVTKYSEDAETGKITINEVNGTDYTLAGLGNKADAMTFDYAGNLYAITSGKEIMTVYALPDALVGANIRTTPAKASLKVKVTNEDILTGVEDIAVDANAPVEYYNLQGVKVENPSNGIFIKKQGTKATKVVL